MILVAGGTGTLGRRVVPRLLASGLRVRVLARHPETAPLEWSESVECVAGDVRSAADVSSAMTGVSTVLSLVHGFAYRERDALQTVDRQGNANLADAAAAAGAAVVLLSFVRADSQSGLELFRVKHDAEQHLRRTVTAWTIVRATPYMETWLDVMDQTAGPSGRPLVYGHGRNPINFVAADDVAALVERCVSDPSTRHRDFQIGGPENVTMNTFAAAAQRAAGRWGAPRHVSRASLTVASALGRLQPMLARQAQVALMMDTADMTFDSAPLKASLPGLPVTSLRDLLASRAREPAAAVRRESPLAP